MRAALLGAVASALLVGCGGPSHACDELNGVVERWLAAELATATAKLAPAPRAAAEGVARTLHPALRDAVVKSCRDSKWASDTIACVAAASDDATARACPLTRDQSEALARVVMDATTRALEGSNGPPSADAAPLAP